MISHFIFPYNYFGATLKLKKCHNGRFLKLIIYLSFYELKISFSTFLVSTWISLKTPIMALFNFRLIRVVFGIFFKDHPLWHLLRPSFNLAIISTMICQII